MPLEVLLGEASGVGEPEELCCCSYATYALGATEDPSRLVQSDLPHILRGRRVQKTPEFHLNRTLGHPGEFGQRLQEAKRAYGAEFATVHVQKKLLERRIAPHAGLLYRKRCFDDFVEATDDLLPLKVIIRTVDVLSDVSRDTTNRAAVADRNTPTT